VHSPQWLILCREANAVHFYRKAGEVWTLRESCGEESSATSKHQAAIAAACQSGRPECKVLHNGEMVKLVASVMGDDAVVASFPADLQSFHRDANEAAADATALVLRKHVYDHAITRQPNFAPATQRVASKVHAAKWWVLGGVCAILLTAIPVPHRIRCEAICEPATKRYLCAPYDGIVSEAFATSGDQVSKGECLALLDGSHLINERSALEAELAQAAQARSAALSAGDRSKAAHQKLEMDRLSSELRLIDQKQSELRICSPITGIIVGGDLSRASGAPVKKGDCWFEVTPMREFVAELAIPESKIMFAEEMQKASVRFHALGSATLEGKVDKIYARSEIRGNENVFIADVRLPEVPEQVRPGMQGTAKIRAGYRSIFWLVLDRPYNALRSVIGW
jgi:biotin carboxyl carrier protein